MKCLFCDKPIWSSINDSYKICNNCGIIKVKKILSQDLYKFDNYSKYQIDSGYLPYHLRFDNDYQVAKCRIKYLLKHVTTGSLIDVGAGSGAFVKCANEYNFEAIGYEIDYDVAMMASKLSGCKISNIISSTYDIVTMFDVIEHLENPFAIPHGSYMHLELPILISNNYDGWKHFKPKEHIWCFTLDTISKYAQKANYTIVDMYTPISNQNVVLTDKLGLILYNTL
jgi:hypothetical protein